MLNNSTITQILPQYLSNVSLLQLKHTNKELKNLYPTIRSYTIQPFSQEMFDATSSKSLIDYIEPPKKIDTMKHIVAENSPELIQYCYDKGYPINEDIIEEVIYKRYKNSFLWLKHNNFILYEENYLLALQKGLHEQNSNLEITAVNYLQHWNQKLNKQTQSKFSNENPFIMHPIINSITISKQIRNEYQHSVENMIQCEKTGLTDLHYASMYADAQILDIIIQDTTNDSINYEDYYRRTPLQFACKFENTQALTYLLNNGAIHKNDKKLDMVFYYIIKNNNTLCFKLVIENLSNASLIPESLKYNIVAINNTTMMKILINKNITIPSILVNHAICFKNIDMLKLLVDNCCFTTCGLNKTICSPLHDAIGRMNSNEMTQILCHYRFPETKTRNGMYPLDYAEYMQNFEIIKILYQYGYTKKNFIYS